MLPLPKKNAWHTLDRAAGCASQGGAARAVRKPEPLRAGHKQAAAAVAGQQRKPTTSETPGSNPQSGGPTAKPGPPQRTGAAAQAAAAQHQHAAAVRATQQQLTAVQASGGCLQSTAAPSAGQVQLRGNTLLWKLFTWCRSENARPSSKFAPRRTIIDSGICARTAPVTVCPTRVQLPASRSTRAPSAANKLPWSGVAAVHLRQ